MEVIQPDEWNIEQMPEANRVDPEAQGAVQNKSESLENFLEKSSNARKVDVSYQPAPIHVIRQNKSLKKKREKTRKDSALKTVKQSAHLQKTEVKELTLEHQSPFG